MFYRDTIRRAAVDRGVAGSAVNLPDGSVECFFEGSQDDVEQMIEVAREGSRMSRVEMVETNWLEPTGTNGFTTG
ncbi:MAG: acylphosphatase [Solirubrobacterales bacterium]